MLRLTHDILEKWRGSAEEFQEDLLRHCYEQSRAVGLNFEFDQTALRAAHHSWVGDCGSWEAQHKAEGSDGLSHLKILALLLHNLASNAWVKPDSVVAYQKSEREADFSGSEETRLRTRQNFIDGEGVTIAFEFVFYCLNWFEYKRTDRLGEFEFRLTHAMKHDFIVFLSGSDCCGAAVYLIIKALYCRDPKSESLHV